MSSKESNREKRSQTDSAEENGKSGGSKPAPLIILDLSELQRKQKELNEKLKELLKFFINNDTQFVYSINTRFFRVENYLLD